jgi:threonyl-tRNA synthetase
LWLAPLQAKVLSLKSDCIEYAKEVTRSLSDDLRVEADIRGETLSKKIREAEIEKVPYIIVVGAKEIEAKVINVRTRGTRESKVMTIEEFIDKAKKQIKQGG